MPKQSKYLHRAACWPSGAAARRLRQGAGRPAAAARSQRHHAQGRAPIAITDQLPGRTTAFRVAEVRPQVTGIVQKRLFAEGTEVKAGEQLFQIDAGSYRAALSSAAGRAQARRGAGGVRAKLLAERYAAADRGQRGLQTGERRSHRRARARRSGCRLGARRRSMPRASTWSTRRCCRRSAGASAARWSPKARWSPADSRARSPPCSSSILSTSTSRSRPPRCCACSASSPSGELVKDDNNQAEVEPHARGRQRVSGARPPQGVRSVGGSEHRLRGAARGVPESAARAAARHVRARAARAGHALGGAAGAAARRLAQPARRGHGADRRRRTTRWPSASSPPTAPSMANG